MTGADDAGGSGTYHVGGRWPHGIPPLGNRFGFSGPNGASLLFAFQDPTAREIWGVRRGHLRLGLLEAGLHTLFLLVHQPEVLDGWGDCPFAWCKVDAERRWLPRPAPGRPDVPFGYAVTVHMTDQNGIVRAIRRVSVSPRFRAALDDALTRQASHADDFSVAAHDAEIAAAYAHWPTVEAMVSAAAIVETAGLPFPAAEEA